ncbi:MAG: hypothetical protein MJ247_07640 [Alphaproteobacteria bacterium]|nr:hypothetical protein [Alphaproteobacteria bacterium]
MKILISIITTFIFFFSYNVIAQDAVSGEVKTDIVDETKNETRINPEIIEIQKHDPNEPLPESNVRINIPHSNRTKDNMLESFMDFTFNKVFSSFEDLEIKYSSFEMVGFTLIKFKDVNIKSNKTLAKGKIHFDTLTLDAQILVNPRNSDEKHWGSIIAYNTRANLILDNGNHKFSGTIKEFSAKGFKISKEAVRFEQIMSSNANVKYDLNKFNLIKTFVKKLEFNALAPYFSFEYALVNNKEYTNPNQLLNDLINQKKAVANK